MAISITNVREITSKGIETIRSNPIVSLAGAGLIGTAVTGAIAVRKITKSRKKRKTVRRSPKRKIKRRSSRKRTTTKKRRIRKTPRTAGKGKDRSTKRIRMTKNGQPYVILRSGKARFIKKSSARRSRKLKGGRY